MDHREKVQHFIDDMRSRGIGSYTSAPPLYRLLWLLGSEVRPPHFQSFLALATLTGTVFGVLFGVFMYFWQWRSMGMSIRVTIVAAAVTGALFGVLLAAYYKWSAHRLKLPDWEHYTPLSRADRDGPHI